VVAAPGTAFASCFALLAVDGCNEKKEFYKNSLARHWARDWRALALTQKKNFILKERKKRKL